MNVKRIAAIALVVSLLPLAGGARGFGGGGRSFGGGGYHPPSGGFDFHGDSGASHPQSFSHSSTGPAGTNRTTTASNTGNGYNRSTTATNGDYSRTSTGAASNGSYHHTTNTSTPYGQHSSAGNANVNGNYNRTASGSNAYGSYNTSANGNAYDHTYNKTTNGSNIYGQTYHGSTSAYNGTVYHGAYVTNPVYGGYPAWGWNAGMAWYPAPYYYGGGFWGAFAIGVTSAAVYGSIVAANSQTITSYQVAPQSPGAKLLASYKLTQVPCGPPNLVVIYGPNNSAICAEPNSMVAAGDYNVDSSNLSIVSAKPA
jgi:hypothetical protein